MNDVELYYYASTLVNIMSCLCIDAIGLLIANETDNKITNINSSTVSVRSREHLRSSQLFKQHVMLRRPSTTIVELYCVELIDDNSK